MSLEGRCAALYKWAAVFLVFLRCEWLGEFGRRVQNSRRHSPLGMLLDPHSAPQGRQDFEWAANLNRVVTFMADTRYQARGMAVSAGRAPLSQLRRQSAING